MDVHVNLNSEVIRLAVRPTQPCVSPRIELEKYCECLWYLSEYLAMTQLVEVKLSTSCCEIVGSYGTAKFLCGGSVTAHAVDLPVSYTRAVVSGEHGSMRSPPGALSS